MTDKQEKIDVYECQFIHKIDYFGVSIIPKDVMNVDT